MFTDLVKGEIVEEDGQPRRLTLEEATMFSLLLASAGTETVARLIGWAGVVLADHPDQRAELAADSSTPPQRGGGATALRGPVTGAGPLDDGRHGIPRPGRPGQLQGAPDHGSAGRDERAFPDADHFDIHRVMDHHLSFGYGVHFCLGAALARLEGRGSPWRRRCGRFPQWSVDLDRAVPLHTSTVRGYTKLPITF